jgi:predicted HTH domain antitoxin
VLKRSWRKRRAIGLTCAVYGEGQTGGHSRGTPSWRLEKALELYAAGEITKARAAELAGVSLYEIMDAIQERDLRSSYSLEDAEEDLAEVLHGLR